MSVGCGRVVLWGGAWSVGWVRGEVEEETGGGKMGWLGVCLLSLMWLSRVRGDVGEGGKFLVTCSKYHELTPDVNLAHDIEIFTKRQKSSQNGQNRAREWKEREKSKSTEKSKVKDEADIEEILNGPTRTHLMGQDKDSMAQIIQLGDQENWMALMMVSLSSYNKHNKHN
ncbi:hypothetical protein Tco_0820289 [Tanacetum coccineum]|uniref:Uncharacterized protein n=1 Tax=Tanacetum coccineum TaxID=301880 RepID=A0ABQ5A8Z8_9ASTR